MEIRILFLLGITLFVLICQIRIKKRKDLYFPVFCKTLHRTVNKNIDCKSCHIKTCLHNCSK